jgi:hypothetical protein
MTPQLKNLLIILGVIAIILVLIILLFGGKSPIRRFINLFLEETDVNNGRGSAVRTVRASSPSSGAVSRSMGDNYTEMRSSEPAEPVQKKTSEPVVVMATLIRKCDDRLRVIESSGQVKLIDEYSELMFLTRKGKKLKIQCSRDAYEKVPFNQEGSLTYKRNTLVKFKYYEDTVFNS